METKTALVRADSGVELNSEALVDLNLAAVVNPCYSEKNYSFGHNKALDDIHLLINRVLLDNGLKRFENLTDSLNELRLNGVALDCFVVNRL